MAITRTEMWKSNTFTIERIEGEAPRSVIYQITGTFNARDMYGSMKQVQLGNIFEAKPEPGICRWRPREIAAALARRIAHRCRLR